MKRRSILSTLPATGMVGLLGGWRQAHAAEPLHLHALSAHMGNATEISVLAGCMSSTASRVDLYIAPHGQRPRHLYSLAAGQCSRAVTQTLAASNGLSLQCHYRGPNGEDRHSILPVPGRGDYLLSTASRALLPATWRAAADADELAQLIDGTADGSVAAVLFRIA